MSLTAFALFKALVLGFVGGLTELIPVSSSAHLLLAQRFLGAGEFGTAFVLLVRLAALLGLLAAYAPRLAQVASGFARDAAARRLVVAVAAAFLPAALIGVLAHDLVRGPTDNIWIACFALIVGGAILLWVDKLGRAPRTHAAEAFSPAMALVIGLAQGFALLPGVSRSAAAIVAALLLGADRKAAAEFSLWLAMPMLAATTAYDLYAAHGQLGSDNPVLLGIGFVAAFAAAFVVAKGLVDYAAERGFALFAAWRVILGSLGLIALALGR